MLGGRVVVAPRVAPGPAGRRVEPGRLLPLRLGGQPLAGPRARTPAPRSSTRAPPARRRGTGSTTPNRRRNQSPSPSRRQNRGAASPASIRCAQPAGAPPARVGVAAGRDELGVLAVGDRRGVDDERRHVDAVRGALVVQRPRLGGGAHGERPGRAPAPRADRQRAARAAAVGASAPVARRAAGGWPASSRRAAARAARSCRRRTRRSTSRRPCQRAAVQHVEHLVPHLGHVRPGLGRAEQRQRRPGLARACWNAS